MEPLDALVGRRVSLRHRVGDRDGRPLYTDAVGELADGDGAEVVVRTRRGPVRVRRDAVVAVRAVPPAPPRRPSWAAVQRLEAVCAAAHGPDPRRERVTLGSPAAAGLVPSGEEVDVLVAELVKLPHEVAAGRAVVVDEHVHLSQLGAGQVDLPDTGARWAVIELPADAPSEAASWHELGFVNHHRVRYLGPDAAAATSGLPSPPA